jgi:TPP-dependent pyruvate/acetoin dehydrogenase alpha subunit
MPVKAAGGSLISDAKLRQLYASMLRSRLLAEYARRLRRRRADAFYRASMGQEALITGCAIDLRAEDAVVDTIHPEASPARLVKGVSLREVVAELGTRARRVAGPPLKFATDAALANKEQNTNVVVVFSSATALGRLRAAVKVASAHSLPIIFVVENNPWAGKDSKVRNLKMDAKGLTRITVDGNDVVAVYRVAYESMERVRQGGGPVLIEGKMYRQDGKGSVRSERDPLGHMEQYLAAKKLFTQRWKDQLVQRFSRELEAATRYLRASSPVAND